MCQKNVGRLDAYLRISTGVILTSVGIMRDRGWLTVVGGMKIAEGITRYCPMLDLMGYSTVSDEEFIEDVLGVECEDEYIPEEEHVCQCGHGHHDHHEHDAHHEYGDRRQYIHRSIKRNQYLNRDI